MDIEYVAKLARIELSEKEKAKFSRQLKDILAYIEQLKQLNTDSVEPISHVLPLKNVFRQDTLKPSLTTEQALNNAPAKSEDSFSVPRIIE
ncbi:MAG: Asp-tRNA(Asn)/Glu-tRNA(Gln) amidotransferase subunit GatC [Candidatus Omnitrophica bacterium]|nr:Asp-tRNA(Asn)/Glu-tRNA(Gln) amidotransferase subunit GatC [Candidatus Omnitrophota bacterium]